MRIIHLGSGVVELLLHRECGKAPVLDIMKTSQGRQTLGIAAAGLVQYSWLALRALRKEELSCRRKGLSLHGKGIVGCPKKKRQESKHLLYLPQ
ncbi:unnamed protein product, partial [Caretta caretta]